MDDTLIKLRKKYKFAFEIRYEPIVQMFDRRGQVLEKVFPKFSSKMMHWRTGNVGVNILDSLETRPSNQILIDHRHTLLIRENTQQVIQVGEFYDETILLLKTFLDIFHDNKTKFERVGVRFINIFETRSINGYEDLIKHMKNYFLANNCSIIEKMIDFHISLKHEFGNITIGPVHDGDPWIAENFAYTAGNIPKFGVALDIDSYLDDLANYDIEQITKDLFATTIALEKSIVDQLITR